MSADQFGRKETLIFLRGNDVDVVADSPGDVRVTFEDFGGKTVLHLPLDVTHAQWDAAMVAIRACMVANNRTISEVLRTIADAIGETPSMAARRVLQSADKQVAARTAEFLPHEEVSRGTT